MPPGCAYTFYFFLSRLFYFGRDSCFYLCQWCDFFLLGATFLSGVSFMPAPGYGPYVSLIIV